MKTCRYNALQILRKVYRNTLEAVPFSGISGILNYLAQGLFPAVTALILARLFDAAGGLADNPARFSSVLLYGCLFVGTYVVVYVLQFIASITINAGIYERCTSFYKMKISEKNAELPLLAFENADMLNLQKRAKDCVDREVLSQIYMSSTVFITSGISVVATVSVLAAYNILFIPISVLSVLPYFVMRILRGREFYNLKKAQAKKARRVEYLWGLLHNRQAAREMRVMGFGPYLSEQWRRSRDEVNEELWRQNLRDARSMLFCDALKILGYGLSVLLALLLALNGKISIGVFGACIAAFKSMQEEARAFLIDLGNMPEKVAFANDYYAFLDLEPETNGQKPVTSLTDSVSLSHVSFTYPNGTRPALTDVSLRIRKGEKVVILGVNGSGKTTLSKILLNLYAPTSGEVRYDDTAAQEADKSTLYRMCSLVQQNFVSYKLTLRENVALSDLAHLQDDNRVAGTLREAGLAELTEDLDMQLGREFGGRELSGGQWQKLAIARGLFRDSELIVLDEPTSALDPMMEAGILQQFINIAKEKTAVIISHRVGLCKQADRVIVMQDGRIVEDGNHRTLMERDGEYRRLYTMQAQWYQ